ncbi:MAG: hypothetical protein B6I26_04665 [Desulfobacteraceae bacterium 4572_130]|nr:MAG: hypothetical protein B6I26_04665 [Desulfobacteraceae bacterium 4572_130]
MENKFNKSNDKCVKILSDHPEEQNVEFGFSAYVKTIADLIAFNNNKTPFTIGIYGSWGTGKTTLMKSIKQSLDNDNRFEKDPQYRLCKTVWFQAWKYNNKEEIFAALIEKIFKTMESDNDFFVECRIKIEKIIKSLDKKGIATSLIKAMTGVNVNQFFRNLKHKDKLGFYDIFQNLFDDLIWTYLNNSETELNKIHENDDSKGVLVIFIDDLDRCPYKRIIKVLETIKLFMDKKSCVFVIGAANEIITRALALEETYKDNASDFMEKIVQVTFNLPKIPEDDFQTYIKKLEDYSIEEILEHIPILIPVLKNNPRNLKRFLNDISLMEVLLANKKVKIEKSYLFLWKIIESRFSGFLRFIKKNEHGNIKIMQKIIDSHKKDTNDLININEISEEIKGSIPDALKDFFKDNELVQIIDKLRCSKDELEQLITLTQIVERKDIKKEKIDDKTTFSPEKMVNIKAGKFLYGHDKIYENIDYDYEIGLYPVTNKIYRKFINSHGYFNKEFWDKSGWEWKDKNNIFQPQYISDKKFNDPYKPVIGVSFYEACAFCKWLSQNKNNGFKYRLPNEKEWEKASRGNDGRVYPWGDEFDKNKCNTYESEIKKTTKVFTYSNGTSPYGCYDMAGNVWEWTNSFYDNNKDSYVLLGGSFYNGSGVCRYADRNNNDPNNRISTVGFRCARIITL